MSCDTPAEKREDPSPQPHRQQPQQPAGNSSGNGVAAAAAAGGRPSSYGDRRLRLNPNKEHRPERYDDVQTEFDPCIFSSLERHLPPSMLEVPRDAKVQFMKEILARYLPDGERTRVQRHREYRNRILSAYKPLHEELYNMHPSAFLVPSFIKAINDSTGESFRNLMSEPSPGVYSFPMLQARFCELLLSEVENFEGWVSEVKFKIMRPNTMNKYGAVLDDFGLEKMLDKLMEEFICPISRGFHVDDSEVTLNVCLGKKFSGGDLFFRGVRCDKHVNSETQPEEILDYAHVPGQAVLHRGRHRHGARATTSGHRINLLLWCRSSVFREMRKYQRDFSSWCGECQREKKERQRQSVTATKLAERCKKWQHHSRPAIGFAALMLGTLCCALLVSVGDLLVSEGLFAKCIAYSL